MAKLQSPFWVLAVGAVSSLAIIIGETFHFKNGQTGFPRGGAHRALYSWLRHKCHGMYGVEKTATDASRD